MSVRTTSGGRILWGILPTSAALLLTGCSTEPPPRAEAARPVKTMVVAAGEEPRVRAFPGILEAARRVELAFRVPGLIVSLPIMEGQSVAKGDVIAKLRTDEFEARLKTLQGQLDQARATLRALRAGERPEERLRREAQVRAADAQLTNARAELDRATQLLQRNAMTPSAFEAAETRYRVAQEERKAAVQLRDLGLIAREEDLDAAEAAVRSLEGQVVEASIQLEDCTLRAPYDGVIAQRFVEPNQNVRANDPVANFKDLEEISIAVDVPETVMAGGIQTADILSMYAEFSGAPGLQLPVHITEVAQTADPTTQTFNVRVAMETPEGIRALPGMTAAVTVVYRRAEVLGDRLLVPVSAISKESDGAQVAWVIGEDQAVSRRPIETGVVTGGEIEVKEGLRPGDRIAVAGVRFLREGMKVRDLAEALGGGA